MYVRQAKEESPRKRSGARSQARTRGWAHTHAGTTKQALSQPQFWARGQKQGALSLPALSYEQKKIPGFSHYLIKSRSRRTVAIAKKATKNVPRF